MTTTLSPGLDPGLSGRFGSNKIGQIKEGPSWLGWSPSLLTRPGFPQKLFRLSTKETLFWGHHRDSQQWRDDMGLNISLLTRLGRRPENAMWSDIKIDVLRLIKLGVICSDLNNIIILAYLCYDHQQLQICYCVAHSGSWIEPNYGCCCRCC